MATSKDPIIREAFAPHLQPGETLESWAYGVKQPSLLLVVPLFFLAILPGVIAVALLTKHYLLGRTDRRVLALRVAGSEYEVQEVTEYGLDEELDVEASSGAIFAHVTVRDEARPFKAKFHRAFAPDNREHAVEAAQALGAAVAA